MTEEIKLGIKAILEKRKEYDALNYINELEKENEELEEIRGQQARIINNDTDRIERLKAQIEKMKCCGNCKYHDCCYVEVPCSCCIRGLDNENENDVDEWEIYD